MSEPVHATHAAIVTSRATLEDLDALALLFDGYRVFYRQAPDLQRARDFMAQRLRHDQSVIFIARDTATGAALGFTQLYPSFSSVSACRIWVLNDLFVAPQARQRGVARKLMACARHFARDSGAARLVLETAQDNHAAQALYEALGYVAETGTRHYSLELA